MKYLGLGYYDPKAFEALSEAEQKALGAQCAPLDEEFRETGKVVAEASLGPGAGVVLRPGSGETSVTDGPFAETKEIVGSFFIIEADTLEEAVEIASLHPAARTGRELAWGIELRPIGLLGIASDEGSWTVETDGQSRANGKAGDPEP